MPTMETPGGLSLRYESHGSGEPVLTIHGAFIADLFEPVAEQLVPHEPYRLITYARRGYHGSSPTQETTTVTQQASDAIGLLSELGIERAHVVGHSYGGCVALQMALDASDRVHSLALIEPALMVGQSGPAYRRSLIEASRGFEERGGATALDEALKARCPGYRSLLDRWLPEAFEVAVADAPSTFRHELPGLLSWTFDEDDASRITQPTLSILGGKSNALWPRFGETHEALLEWLPDAEERVLPGRTHLPQVEDPGALAQALASFWAKHPMQRT